MDQPTQGVETTQQSAPAPATGVETSSARAPEHDPESTILALQERLKKVESERDNYRKATLALKGKGDTEDYDTSDPDQVRALARKEAQELFLEMQQTQVQKEYEAEVARMARENKELKLALSAKSSSTSIAGGAGAGAGFSSSSEVKTSYFSPEQVEAMKTRWRNQGIDESKFEAMVKQVEAQSRRTDR